MPIEYDLKTDIRFLQGKEIGMKEGMIKGRIAGRIEEQQIFEMQLCIRLLESQALTIAAIAEIIEQDIQYVIEVQTYLQQETLVEKSLKKGMEKEEIAKKTNVSLVFINAIEHIMKSKEDNIN